MAAVLFALDTTHAYGERVAHHLGTPLSAHEERDFEDGEHKTRPLIDVSSQDVFVLHALQGGHGRSANDKLCRLLFFIAALKDADAKRVTAVTPYLCYARKDQRTKARDPVTTKYVAQLFEACGTDAIITFDVHNAAAFENAFRRPTTNIEALPLFVAHLAPALRREKVAVVSPDLGGTKRADRFRLALAAELDEAPTSGFIDKRRSEGIVSGDTLVGDIRGRTVILYDDLISTGTTLRRAAEICMAAGARKIIAAATHGLFSGPAASVLADPVFSQVLVTDTALSAKAGGPPLPAAVTVLDSTQLLADVIAEAHTGR